MHRNAIQLTLAPSTGASLPRDPERLRPKLLVALEDFQLAGRHVQQTRQLLRKVLVGRLKFEPVEPSDFAVLSR